MHFTSPKSKVTIHPRSNLKHQLGDKLRNHQKPHLGSLLQVGLAEATHVRVFGWILRSKEIQSRRMSSWSEVTRKCRLLKEQPNIWVLQAIHGIYMLYILWTCGFLTWTARNLESWNLPSLDGEMLILQAALVKLVKFESWAAVQHGDGAATEQFLDVFKGQFIGQRHVLPVPDILKTNKTLVIYL